MSRYLHKPKYHMIMALWYNKHINKDHEEKEVINIAKELSKANADLCISSDLEADGIIKYDKNYNLNSKDSYILSIKINQYVNETVVSFEKSKKELKTWRHEEIEGWAGSIEYTLRDNRDFEGSKLQDIITTIEKTAKEKRIKSIVRQCTNTIIKEQMKELMSEQKEIFTLFQNTDTEVQKDNKHIRIDEIQEEIIELDKEAVRIKEELENKNTSNER